LRECTLRGACFDGANLTNAHLQHADLRDASLRDADFEGANFAGADLRGACLLGCRLLGASFWETASAGESEPAAARVDRTTQISPESLEQLTPEQDAYLRARLTGADRAE
jgi:uncharacterized protein YjbI with pentapeptide repeats